MSPPLWPDRSGQGLTGVALGVLLVMACGGSGPSQDGPRSPSDAELEIPAPDLTGMEPQVAKRLRQTRGAVMEEPRSGTAWGRFGMVAHAHELWEEAIVAYGQAESLAPEDVRWPYYLGDVLSVVGTDLPAAERAFRRAMARRPDYAPAHMRLGRVLFAAGEWEPAALELERAVELEPGLLPAQVTLAQIRLAQGDLDSAAEMLEGILAQQPRHAQALSALGQVYLRQGRRNEARQIAERARHASSYNLYSDPLMSNVVAEGVSSVLIWDRARAFMENGNYRQAALGLAQVVVLQPSNADAHHQLAIAYGNLGEVDRSRHHLERTVDLLPDRVESRIQLATVHLDQQNPAPAIAHLKRARELAPEDPDAGWLLGRAQVLAGDVRGALASFETTRAAGGEVPAWARNEWGSALAQTGQADAALAQFRAALAADPDNAQTLFLIGLLYEGRGRTDEAVERYCRSMRAQPNPPAGSRLKALGRTCR